MSKQYDSEYDGVLRNARSKPNLLPAAEIHPSISHTRLAAMLRQYSDTASGWELPGLINGVLQQPHEHPYPILPLQVLRDWLQDNPNHPLNKHFDWSRLPDKVLLDLHLREKVDAHNENYPEQLHGTHPRRLFYAGFHNPDSYQYNTWRKDHDRIKGELQTELPGLTAQDIDDSGYRLGQQQNRKTREYYHLPRGDQPDEMHDWIVSTHPISRLHVYNHTPERFEDRRIRSIGRTSISRSRETGEWVVKCWDQEGKRHSDADYHTTDREDAERTAVLMTQPRKD